MGEKIMERIKLTPEYCAGFFDGEGSVYAAIRKGKNPTIVVCISNTNLEVLEAHKDTYGGSIAKRKNIKPRHKQQWQWVLAAKMARPFLILIHPFLIIKKDVVEEAIKYCEIQNLPLKDRMEWIVVEKQNGKKSVGMYQKKEIKEKLVLIHGKIRELNKRGAPANVTREWDLSVNG